ncbi:MAG: LapA family protein [Burkholderiales bacterium]
MRIVTWTIRLIIFLFLLALAAKNVAPVTLNFYFDRSWQAPLVVVLFGFFAAGALFGLISMVSVFLGQRREIQRLKRGMREHAKATDAARATGSGRPPVADA